MKKLRVLDLFSGIGGFSLGLERTGGFETVAFCEIEEFPRRVLKKHWPEVPCYHDVRELTADVLRRDGIGVDVICGGFPCQDISTAGKKKGIGEGTRSGLWSEIVRLSGEIRPRYIVVENVTALLAGPVSRQGEWFGRILGDLAEIRYNAEWGVISASDMGAWHERDRVWIIAYPDESSQPISNVNDEARWMSANVHVEDTTGGQREMAFLMARAWRIWQSLPRDGFWKAENSPIGMGVDDGIPGRLDRLRALGNTVIPQIPELLGLAILEEAGDV